MSFEPTPTWALETRGLSCGYGSEPVLRDVTFAIPFGGITAILGPNGVGKTTLFKTVLGFLPPLEGTVRIAGENAAGWSRREFAQRVAYVPQVHESVFGFTVSEMVLMGRTPSLRSLQSPRAADGRVVEEVLASLGLTELAQRDCTTLSGGELQMVLIARALAQRPKLLVMDEPCASLDLGNQACVLERIGGLSREGLAVVITTHDPNHALLLNADAVCLHRDGTVTTGLATRVLDGERLSKLYGVEIGLGSVAGVRGERRSACAAIVGSFGRRACEGGSPAAADGEAALACDLAAPASADAAGEAPAAGKAPSVVEAPALADLATALEL